MSNKKRGQFYLLAALIIIILIIGFATISNYSRTQRYSKTYDMGQELKIESAQVLDYGIYNEDIGVDQMGNLLQGFIEEYSNLGDLEQLHFIFGNAEQIVFMGYSDLESNLSVEVGVNGEKYKTLKIRKKHIGYETIKRKKTIEDVTVRLNYGGQIQEFSFELNEGENFYFILSQVIKGDRYVTYG